MRFRALAGCIALLACAAPAQAQAHEPPPAPAELPALLKRMKTFADSIRMYGPSESFAAWFPRRGSWTRTLWLHGAPGGGRAVAWHFPASQTTAALSDSGPLCGSFFRGGGEVATGENTIAGWLGHQSRGWRRIGRRFVPRGASATSPTYVEWRREDGQWVIDGFGEVGEYQRFPYVAPTYPALRRSPSPGPVLTLPLAPDGRYASTEPWFRSNGPVWVRGVPRMKYGLPLQFGEGDLTRVGWVEGVPAYVDPADTAFLTVLYLPLDSSGLFQPYQPGTNYFCQP